MAFSSFNPPILEGTIPAFYKEDNRILLKVPFIWNVSVSVGDVEKIQLKLRNAYGKTTDIIADGIDNIDSVTSAYQQGYATYDLTSLESFLVVGSFYKVQLYYYSSTGGEGGGPALGAFSSTAIVKYTAKPSLAIVEYNEKIPVMESDPLSDISQRDSFAGTYINTGDPTEKVYSYTFTITELDDSQLFYEERDKIHNNAENPDSDKSYDVFYLSVPLEEKKIYKLRYSVTTINGLEESSETYCIMKQNGLPYNPMVGIQASLNYENGYVDLEIGNVGSGGIFTTGLRAGSYFISRSDNKNPNSYQTIHEFRINGDIAYHYHFKDFTVEHGLTYNYRIQAYNKYGLYNRLSTSGYDKTSIEVAFEHMFLYAKGKQLKIKYNPRVSSFKTNILENKIDTIGSKYPYMFRNGVVKYKEFPISGFISRLSDEEGLFIELPNQVEPVRQETNASDNIGDYDVFYETNLTDRNIKKEREFKLAVLDWLNNGEAKLFRSPSEGNYIVRTMNNSLSPNDTLGRMLHTFSSTAYEVSDYSWKDMVKMGIIGNDLFETEEVKGGIEKQESVPLNIMVYNSFLNTYGKTYIWTLGSTFSYNINNDNQTFTITSKILPQFYRRTYNFTLTRDSTNVYFLLQDGSIKLRLYGIQNYEWSPISFQQAIMMPYLSGKYNYINFTSPFWGLNVNGCVPGTILRLNGTELITIGSTGTYYIDPDVLIDSIELISVPNNVMPQGIMTYSYLDTSSIFQPSGSETGFNSYKSNKIVLLPVQTIDSSFEQTGTKIIVEEGSQAYNTTGNKINNSEITLIAWAYFYLDESQTATTSLEVEFLLGDSWIQIELSPNHPSYYVGDLDIAGIKIPTSGVKCDICYAYEVYEVEE